MKLPWFFLVALIALSCLSNPLLAQKTDKNAPAEKDAKADSGNVQEVTVEGVGKTPDDALKDALRNAVRQVIGAVVVEEQKLKNDTIVEDKVLSASSGFVTTYKRLKLKEENGLFRITIRAEVEKSELIDKLRSLKYTIRDVDAKRLLRETRFSDKQVQDMTKEEARRDRTEIIQDALADIHNVLDASARNPDRFDYDEATSTLKVDVAVSVDNARYVQFLKRLQLRLDKLSLGRVSGFADAQPKDLPWGGKVPGFQTVECTFVEGPDLRTKVDVWCLWVLTAAVNKGTGTRWTGYILDTDPRKTLAGLGGELKVQVAVRDADGKAIAEEMIDLSKSGWLGVYLPRSKQHVSLDGVFENQSKLLSPSVKTLQVTQERSVSAMIGPMEIFVNWSHVNKIARGAPQFAYCLTRTYPIQVKLDKDEVKRIKDIRCDVQFRAEK